MNLFEWLTTKRRTLATMDAAELRAQEMLLTSECDRLMSRINKLAIDKQAGVENGAGVRG